MNILWSDFVRRLIEPDYALLKPIFDESYYLASNSDLSLNRKDALAHFMKLGWKEGRNPTSWFDTKRYLLANPDVRISGINPFVHFLKFGKNENRRIFALECAPLIEAYDRLTSRSIDIHDVTEPLTSFVPRIDLYLSIRCALEKHYSNEWILSSHFKGTLLAYLKALSSRKMLCRFGRTIDAAHYTLYFPKQELQYLWIPKVACTTVKTELLKRIDPTLLASVPINGFHETINSRFGAPRTQYGCLSDVHEITFIRHPVERIVSCYFDKFASPLIRGHAFEKFALLHIRKIYRQLKITVEPTKRSVSFAEFVRYILAQPSFLHDAHWRPQADFLGPNFKGTRYRVDGINRMLRDVGLATEATIERKNRSSVDSLSETEPMAGNLFEKTPDLIDRAEIKSYNNFLSPSTFRQLSNWLKDDFDLFENAR